MSRMYIFKYLKRDKFIEGGKAEWKRDETRFMAESDNEAKDFAENYLAEKREAFPENEYQAVELFAVRTVKIW